MTNHPDQPAGFRDHIAAEAVPRSPRTLNLFDEIPASLPEEMFQTLVESGSVRIERIVSDGHVTPQGEWYDQGWDEWVLLVSGGATLQFDDGSPPIILEPGNHVMIPAGCRHRVARTDPGQKTIWLAVHIGENKLD